MIAGNSKGCTPCLLHALRLLVPTKSPIPRSWSVGSLCREENISPSGCVGSMEDRNESVDPEPGVLPSIFSFVIPVVDLKNDRRKHESPVREKWSLPEQFGRTIRLVPHDCSVDGTLDVVSSGRVSVGDQRPVLVLNFRFQSLLSGSSSSQVQNCKRKTIRYVNIPNVGSDD